MSRVCFLRRLGRIWVPEVCAGTDFDALTELGTRILGRNRLRRLGRICVPEVCAGTDFGVLTGAGYQKSVRDPFLNMGWSQVPEVCTYVFVWFQEFYVILLYIYIFSIFSRGPQTTCGPVHERWFGAPSGRL